MNAIMKATIRAIGAQSMQQMPNFQPGGLAANIPQYKMILR